MKKENVKYLVFLVYIILMAVLIELVLFDKYMDAGTSFLLSSTFLFFGFVGLRKGEIDIMIFSTFEVEVSGKVCIIVAYLFIIIACLLFFNVFLVLFTKIDLLSYILNIFDKS